MWNEARVCLYNLNGMIREGELVFVYGGEEAGFLLLYQPGKRISTHLGEVVLPENAEFGSAIESSTGNKFYILKPTTTDLMMKVRRTTTIMYPKDVGFLILEAGIGEGSRVLEVGTGSGALTIVLAKIVGKTGKVYSFERRAEFLENARKNVERAGLADRVEFYHLDPAAEGFPVEDVEAAFIDVPEPWTLVDATHKALMGGGRWVSLSPTIEQVLQTYKALDGKFVRLRCVEILEREMLIREGKTRPRERMVSHTGYLVTASKINI